MNPTARLRLIGFLVLLPLCGCSDSPSTVIARIDDARVLEMLRQLKSPDPVARYAAATALGFCGTSPALDIRPLLECVFDDAVVLEPDECDYAEERTVRHAAIDALIGLGPNICVPPCIDAIRASNEPQQIGRLVDVLVRFRDPRVAPCVRQLMTNPTVEVLEPIISHGAPIDRDLNAILCSLVKSAKGPLRVSAGFALSRVADMSCLDVVLDSLATENSGTQVEEHLLRALGRCNDPRSRGTLRLAYNNRRHEMTAINSLAAIANDSTIEWLVAVMHDRSGNEIVRASVAKSLLKYQHGDRIRNAVLHVLFDKSESDTQRGRMCDAVGRYDTADRAEVALTRCMNEKGFSEDLRGAAAIALVELRKGEVDDERIVDRLVHFGGYGDFSDFGALERRRKRIALESIAKHGMTERIRNLAKVAVAPPKDPDDRDV